MAVQNITAILKNHNCNALKLPDPEDCLYLEKQIVIGTTMIYHTLATWWEELTHWKRP